MTERERENTIRLVADHVPFDLRCGDVGLYCRPLLHVSVHHRSQEVFYDPDNLIYDPAMAYHSLSDMGWIASVIQESRDSALDGRLRRDMDVIIKATVVRHFQQCITEISER
ncbi:uncharacterized protein EV420DRAFT_1539728 [Desarmillaria tabescens]|uniref:Uncharacterized protein n=1 Tax=Armillaria tabescens TaxID=1929756 RepID=A0AA39N6M5_ARMTA|nr:uncharacterized protein EV420DRAFT_1539728 [Desarmillaria tabescens]KAK0459348.1 hypothetical protein EV420DRAFT_1539728 [Desarmillaria tabescens]